MVRNSLFIDIARQLENLIEILATMGIAYVVYHDASGGGKAGAGTALHKAFSFWGRGAVTELLAFLITGALMLLLIIPGLIWLIYYTFSMLSLIAAFPLVVYTLLFMGLEKERENGPIDDTGREPLVSQFLTRVAKKTAEVYTKPDEATTSETEEENGYACPECGLALTPGDTKCPACQAEVKREDD